MCRFESIRCSQGRSQPTSLETSHRSIPPAPSPAESPSPSSGRGTPSSVRSTPHPQLLTLFSYLFILLFILCLFYLFPTRRTSGRTTRSGRAGGVPAERCSIVHHRREPARGRRRCRSHHWRRIQPLTRPQRSVATNEWRYQDRMGRRKGNAAKGNGKRERERWAAFAIQSERRKRS